MSENKKHNLYDCEITEIENELKKFIKTKKEDFSKKFKNK